MANFKLIDTDIRAYIKCSEYWQYGGRDLASQKSELVRLTLETIYAEAVRLRELNPINLLQEALANRLNEI